MDMIRPHVESMVRDHRESHQRAASEIMAGLIRGAKHWDYNKVRDNNNNVRPLMTPVLQVSSMWSWVIPAIRQALTIVSPETMRDWGTSFATSSDNRDPNR